MKKSLKLVISLATIFVATGIFVNHNKKIDNINLVETQICSAESSTEEAKTFKDVQTQAKLKFSYEDSDLSMNDENLKIKFGAKVPAVAYNVNAKHGVIVVPNNQDNELVGSKINKDTREIDLNLLTELTNQGYALDCPKVDIQYDENQQPTHYEYAWVLENVGKENYYNFAFSAYVYELTENKDNTNPTIVLGQRGEYSIGKMIDKYMTINLSKDEQMNKNIHTVLDNYAGINRRNVYFNMDIFKRPESKYFFHDNWDEGQIANFDPNCKNNYLFVWGEGNPSGQWLEVKDFANFKISSGSAGAIFAQFPDNIEPNFNNYLYRSKNIDANYLFYDEMITYKVDLAKIKENLQSIKSNENLDNYDLYALGINDNKGYYKREKVQKNGNDYTFNMSNRINEVQFAYVNKDSKELPFIIYPYIDTKNDNNRDNDIIIKDSPVWNDKDIVAITQNVLLDTQQKAINYDNFATIDNVSSYLGNQSLDNKHVYAWVFNGGEGKGGKFVKVNNNKLVYEKAYKSVSFLILNKEQVYIDWNFVNNNHKLYQSPDYKIINEGLIPTFKFSLPNWVENDHALIKANITYTDNSSETVNASWIKDQDGRKFYSFTSTKALLVSSITVRRVKSDNSGDWKSETIKLENYGSEKKIW